MAALKNLNQYLKKRGSRWYYHRRVPAGFSDVDSRSLIVKALNTEELEVARARRDDLMIADEQFWSSVASTKSGLHPYDPHSKETKLAMRLYLAAKEQAMAKGFVYTPIHELVAQRDFDDIARRVEAISEHSGVFDTTEADALLGAVLPPPVTISLALEIYFSEIAIKDQIGKSDDQIRSWRHGMQKAVKNFVRVVGNLQMDKINRSHVIIFNNRLLSANNNQTFTSNAANLDFEHLRILFDKYWEYAGEEYQKKPFQ